MSDLNPSSASPSNNLEQLRKRAKELLKDAVAGDPAATARIKGDITLFPSRQPTLADAQLIIARENNFVSWPKLVHELEKAELAEFRAALDAGDAAAVKRVLQKSPSVVRKINDPLGDFGGRPINIASKHRDVLDLLIDFGADINLRSDWEKGRFSVLDASDEATARHLLTRGATLTAHAASRLGWIDELTAIVQTNPDVVHERGGDGQRPLHFAKTTEIVDFLLDHSAEIDARCVDHHSTALQYSLVDRPEIAKHLLSRGATPDIFVAAKFGDAAMANRLIDENPNCLEARINEPGYEAVPPLSIYCWTLGWHRSPHEVAKQFGHADLRDQLLERSSPKVRLFVAIASNDVEAAETMLVEHPMVRSELTAADHRKLIMAAQFGAEDAALLMLRVGFDANVRNEHGATPLHAAGWSGSSRIIEALLAMDQVDLNVIETEHNATPLGWARYGAMHCRRRGANYSRSIELLERAGAK